VEYDGEVFLVGRRTRICRGCTLAGIGAIAGLGFALFLPPSLPIAALAVPLAAGSAFAPRSMGKLAARWVPGLLLSFAFASGLRAVSVSGLGIALAAVLGVAILIHGYRRRGPHRGPCLACPERDSRHPCRGFARIVRRERAFQRRAGLLLDSR
jgi:hypothetical protein